MTLLPEVRTLLEDAGPSLDPTMSVPDLRRACDAGVLRHHRLVRDVQLHAVRDLEVGGVPVRLYLPSDAESLAVHVHLHGGGWWMGSIETVDPMARELAAASGLAVVSVDYRLAPEHRYPAALDDVYAVLSALSTSELGFTPTSVSVGGESAGANLSAAVCLLARDRGGPQIVAQWLDVPAVDLTAPTDESMELYGTGFGLEMAQLPVLLGWYCEESEVTAPYVSPALAPDLSGLPPTILTTAEHDPIRDQGERFATALAAAGNDVSSLRAPGHIHASSWFTALTPSTAQWYDDVVARLVAHHPALEAAR